MTSARSPFRSRLHPLAVGALALLIALPAAAQAPRVPPVFDQLASPFTDSEIGGMGCLVASGAVGIGMLGLIGGPGALTVAVQGMITPRTVLEASAASAFVFSSSCYIGQALAPVVSLATTALYDMLTTPRSTPTRAPQPPRTGPVSWLDETQ